MDTTQSTNNAIKVEVTTSPITLDEIRVGEFQKEGTKTAQLRQVRETRSTYPSKRIDSSLQQNFFDSEDFGFEGKTFDGQETRMAFVLVPENVTMEQMQVKLEAANKNGACIYRVLSNQPILDEHQLYAISQGLTTVDRFANAQIVRYPEGHEKAGQITLDKASRPQYRKTYFWNTKREDVDNRGKGTPYLSAELKAELAGASHMEGQTL